MAMACDTVDIDDQCTLLGKTKHFHYIHIASNSRNVYQCAAINYGFSWLVDIILINPLLFIIFKIKHCKY